METQPAIGVPPDATYLQHIRHFRPNAKFFLATVSITQICLAIFDVVFNLYLSALGYSLTVIGLFATMQTLGTALTALPAGMFSDRLGRKKSLLVAIGLSMVTTLGQIFLTGSAVMLLVLGFLRGAATTFQSTLSGPFLMENSGPRERIHLFSVNSSLNSISGTAGSALAGLLPVALAGAFGWDLAADTRPLQYTLLASVSLFVASLIPVSLIRERSAPAQAGSILGELKATLRSYAAQRLIMYNALIGSGAGLVLPLFNLFLVKRFHAGVEQVSTVMTGSRLILGTATLLSPFLVRYLGRIRSVTASQLMSVPMLLIIALVPNFWVVAVAFWFRNTLMNMCGPISGSFTMEIVDERRRGTTNGLTTLASNLLRAISVSVAGYVMDHVSLSLPYFGTAVLYTMASLLWYFSFRRDDPPRAPRCAAGRGGPDAGGRRRAATGA